MEPFLELEPLPLYKGVGRLGMLKVCSYLILPLENKHWVPAKTDKVMHLLHCGLHLCWQLFMSVDEDLPDGGCGNESDIFLKHCNSIICCSAVLLSL